MQLGDEVFSSRKLTLLLLFALLMAPFHILKADEDVGFKIIVVENGAPETKAKLASEIAKLGFDKITADQKADDLIRYYVDFDTAPYWPKEHCLLCRRESKRRRQKLSLYELGFTRFKKI